MAILKISKCMMISYQLVFDLIKTGKILKQMILKDGVELVLEGGNDSALL
jgi:hypothetical protein